MVGALGMQDHQMLPARIPRDRFSEFPDEHEIVDRFSDVFLPGIDYFAVLVVVGVDAVIEPDLPMHRKQDRKSTRLNSSHQIISYAVFCLTKKKCSPRASGRWRTRSRLAAADTTAISGFTSRTYRPG